MTQQLRNLGFSHQLPDTQGTDFVYWDEHCVAAIVQQRQPVEACRPASNHLFYQRADQTGTLRRINDLISNTECHSILLSRYGNSHQLGCCWEIAVNVTPLCAETICCTTGSPKPLSPAFVVLNNSAA